MSAWPQYTFVMVAVTAGLSFIAVMTWISARRRERDAYYRTETIKKIAESGTPAAALEYVRETERIEVNRIRAGLTLGSVVLVSVGVGLGIFLWAIDPEERVYAVGGIPLLMGVALFIYSQFMARPD